MTGTINLGDEWEITADETVDDLVIRHKPTANSFTLGADGTFTPLPELAITSVTTVPDKAARLSVSAEEGDIVIQTDVSKTFVLTTNDPTVNSNWVEIQIDVLNTIDGQQITPSQVGTSSNRTDVVADNIEANTIGSQSTSDRPDLIADDVAPRSIASDYLYAGEFSGGDADTRLDNALAAASEGTTIYLEATAYTSDHTISQTCISLIGGGAHGSGTHISNATFDFTGNQGHIKNVGVDTSDGSVAVRLAVQCQATGLRQGAGKNGTIEIVGNRVVVSMLKDVDVTINGSGCVVDSSVNVAVTDNGNNNVIGDIA